MNLEQIEIAQIKFINALRNEPEPNRIKTTTSNPNDAKYYQSFCLCAKGMFFRTFNITKTITKELEGFFKIMRPIWEEMEQRYEGWINFNQHSYKEIADWLINEHNWPDPQKMNKLFDTESDTKKTGSPVCLSGNHLTRKYDKL